MDRRPLPGEQAEIVKALELNRLPLPALRWIGRLSVRCSCSTPLNMSRFTPGSYA
jgi:hypothetical protein